MVTVSYGTGTYAIRYYDPSTLPPQSAPTNVLVSGIPAPVNAVSIIWNSVGPAATGYGISRSLTGAEPYTQIGTTTERFYTDTDVTVGNTYWYKVKAVNSVGGGPDSAAVNVIVPSSAPLSSLTYNTWKAGNLTTGTQVDLYTITAETAGTYFLQWDDALNSTSSYSARVGVTAYRAGGSPVFTFRSNGYTYLASLTLSAGETVYVMVVPYSDLGTYRIRYYQ
jgi:hypothetical protein